MLTVERLKEVLAYDPETGEFRWKIAEGKRRQIGEIAGWIDNCGGTKYRRIMIDGKAYMAHRLAVLYVTGEMPSARVDHMDMDTFNNRWDNLRVATPSQNAANRGPTKRNSSGYKGVHWYKPLQKWRAAICHNYKLKHLGYFDNVEDAAAAYQKAAAERFGEFARTE